MKIFLGTDHAGFALKEQIKFFLKQLGHDVEDCGAYKMDSTDDYPDFCAKVATEVSKNSGSFGIVFGKSGAGEAIVANKVKGVRAFLAINEENVRLAREHNDANVISIGSDFVSYEKATLLITLFLKTLFSHEERHVRRIAKIKKIEDEQC